MTLSSILQSGNLRLLIFHESIFFWFVLSLAVLSASLLMNLFSGGFSLRSLHFLLSLYLLSAPLPIYTLTAPSLCWPLSWWSLISKPFFDMPFWMSYCRFRNNHFIFPLLCQYRQHKHPPANEAGKPSSFLLAPYTLSMYKTLGSSSIIITNLFCPCILYLSSMS